MDQNRRLCVLMLLPLLLWAQDDFELVEISDVAEVKRGDKNLTTAPVATSDNSTLDPTPPSAASTSYTSTASASSTSSTTSTSPLPTCGSPCKPTFIFTPWPACTRDASMLTSEGVLKNPSSLGVWNVSCNRQFLLLHETVAYVDAVTLCCSVNMSFVTIESASKLNCVIELLKYLSTIRRTPDLKLPTWWWNGLVPLGKDDECGLARYRWCPVNIPLDFNEVTAASKTSFLNWSPRKTGASKKQPCEGLLFHNSSGQLGMTLEVKPCGVSGEPENYNWALCEGPITTTTSVPPQTRCLADCSFYPCNKEDQKFDTTFIKRPEKYGTWIKACDRIYLFTKFRKRPWDASISCCQIGGHLVSIESEQEHHCLSAAMRALRLPATAQFWTSATNLGCGDTWAWCDHRTQIATPVEQFVPWLRDGANSSGLGRQPCTILTWDKDGREAALRDEFCDRQYYSAICEFTEGNTALLGSTRLEMPWVKVDPNNVAAVKQCAPYCTTPHVCAVDPFFVEDDGVTYKDPTQHGGWGYCNGRSYLLGIVELTQSDAAEFCCRLGMTLVDLQDDVIPNKCAKLMGNTSPSWMGNREMWTSASSLGCPGKFRSCPSMAPINTTMRWANGPPSGTVETCLILAWSKDAIQVSVSEKPCDNKIYALCASPVQRASTTTTVQPTTCSPYCPNFTCTTERQFDEAAMTCCRLGMQLLAIDSTGEYNFIQKTITGSNIADSMKIYSFWMAGTNRGCTPRWIWCPSRTPMNPKTLNNFPLLGVNADNLNGIESCAAFTSYDGGKQFNIWDRTCYQFINYICKGPKTPPPATGK